MDSHAQQEIRDYANVIGNEIVRPLFPLVWEAFEDYRLESISLSRLDISAIKGILAGVDYTAIEESVFSNKRERNECRVKLERLGFVC